MEGLCFLARVPAGFLRAEKKVAVAKFQYEISVLPKKMFFLMGWTTFPVLFFFIHTLDHIMFNKHTVHRLKIWLKPAAWLILTVPQRNPTRSIISMFFFHNTFCFIWVCYIIYPCRYNIFFSCWSREDGPKCSRRHCWVTFYSGLRQAQGER